MATVDLSGITTLTVQINALQQKSSTLQPSPAKDLLDAQVSMLEAELTANAQHMQAQLDANNNLMNGLGLFAVLNQLVGGVAPTVINLFK